MKDAKFKEVLCEDRLMASYGDCVHCGGEIEERLVQVDYRLHGQLYILENVRAGVCQQCGEQFFTGEVAKQMESTVESARGDVPTIPVPVIAMAK